MLKTLEHAESEPTIYEFYDSEKKLKTLLKVQRAVKKTSKQRSEIIGLTDSRKGST